MWPLLCFLFVSSCDFSFSFSKRKKIVLNITQCSGSFQSFITNTSADKCNTAFPAYIRTCTQIYKHLNTHTHTHILPNQLWAGPHKWISRNPKPLLPCPSHHHCGILSEIYHTLPWTHKQWVRKQPFISLVHRKPGFSLRKSRIQALVPSPEGPDGLD